MDATTGRFANVRADDLLMLLAVARTGRYTAAAQVRGVDHTTVARRIAALEDALGGRVVAQSGRGWELTALGRHASETAGRIEAAMSHLAAGAEEPDPVSGVVRMSATDGFSAYIAAPAISALRERHPDLAVEIVAAQRRAALHRPGLDLEVVVGEPQTSSGSTVELGSYTLGMYASRSYLAEHGSPRDLDDLQRHRLVYFVDAMLQVEAVDLPRRIVPHMRDGVTSTNVLVQVEATRAGAGIGMLPCFAADRHDDLVRLLPGSVAERLPYWMIVRADSLRIPAVAALAEALRDQTARSAAMLDGVG
ncbi:DNA-binding transcriptional regulator, LysR family [Microbacterium sp. ru370.1]|uniref:LysR family transcriptional regulator n=1 Tax=unclassified Microbacterium TaxID=2609290 RepID=UPI0008850718|nr:MULTISPECIES: LysR family transcriptional regulator [unclassified Microbacterium]SDO33453.1 DNA-binding transcriptional regulator, LysR family [Microbacterium sp. ru370.1]SIT77069.1 DNA-binding transcriptional regulator, LysR family [Microbacterium sp. RU1D]